MTIADGDTVALEYVGRLDDGTVFDTSRQDVAADEGLLDEQPGREYSPLEVEVGAGKVIEGLDEALVGMAAGDREVVTIPPEKGYGARSEDRVVTYERDQLDEMLQGASVEEGMQLQTEQGLPGEVVDVGEDVVKVDFNHRLAGETLEFDVEIVSID
ncbi:FKBP-type peptidyl-prolyl cis-trans isomerase [Halorarius litoreus]|uniref:FKBP-type peptidyl-prolyl cis-trans isomerase n=1 Tax=Halorarius litoreus TaxID=2962676 RepID=UPI0020CDEE82|nr:FKBP-type peptidyl-prolyl cis-trans isomerase [Halorarius litoreus]